MQRERRIRHILDTLAREDAVSVGSLVSRFKVSHMTVRRDLAELEAQGYLIRRYGGAVKSEAIERLFSFARRLEKAGEQKEQICRAAARFVQDGEVIFIDCGTTLFRLCRHITRRRSLRVITNSLPVVAELLPHSQIRVSLIGGEVVGERQAIYGPAAERAIGEYHADKAFIGADGLSLAKGLSSYDEKEAGVTRQMAEHARQVYLLCDSSKIERDSYFRFAPPSLFDLLITDGKLEGSLLKRYREHGIRIITE
jgi:DeoR family fructose operon transcriptional repressor